mgnify:CR=1 FL=1
MGGPDHPRSRGVYSRGVHRPASPPGSSPLARGLRHGAHTHLLLPGIIPARAGFTGVIPRVYADRRDHPRSRGVYTIGTLGSLARTGSSPLARGLRRVPRPGLRTSRIIPARAGFTASGSRSLRSGSDHPRSRGVYLRFIWEPNWFTGSSPLARGLRRLHRNPHQGSGIIPARAGFTPGDS